MQNQDTGVFARRETQKIIRDCVNPKKTWCDRALNPFTATGYFDIPRGVTREGHEGRAHPPPPTTLIPHIEVGFK